MSQLSDSALIRVWAWPLALALLTASGLISALVSGGGWGQAWSWFALGLPVAVMAWFGMRPSSSKNS